MPAILTLGQTIRQYTADASSVSQHERNLR